MEWNGMECDLVPYTGGILSSTDSKGALTISLDDKNQIDSNRRAINELTQRVDKLEQKGESVHGSPAVGAAASGVRPSLIAAHGTSLLPVPVRSDSLALPRNSISSGDSTTTGGLTNQLLNDDHDLLQKTVYLVRKNAEDIRELKADEKELKHGLEHVEQILTRLQQGRDRDREEYKSLIAGLAAKIASLLAAQAGGAGGGGGNPKSNDTVKTSDDKPANSSYQSTSGLGLEDDARIALLREYCSDQFNKLWDRWQMCTYLQAIQIANSDIPRPVASRRVPSRSAAHSSPPCVVCKQMRKL